MRCRSLPCTGLALLLGGVAAPAEARPLAPASKRPAPTSMALVLYAGLEPRDPFLYVEARVGSEPLLLRIDTASSEVHLAPSAVARLGLEPADETHRLRLDALELGDVVLQRVLALGDDAPDQRYGVDGTLGLLAFPGVSWAVLPSRGVVLVGPNTDAPAMLASVLGAPTVMDAGTLRERRVRVGADARWVRDDYVNVDVPVSGVTLPAAWQTAQEHTWVAREVDRHDYALGPEPAAATPLPEAPASRAGGLVVEGRDVLGVPTRVERPALGSTALALPTAGVGIDVAQWFDLALDNGGHRVAVARAAALVKADYGDRLEARLRSALVPDDGTPTGRAAHDEALSAYALFLEQRDRQADAAFVRSALAQQSPESCGAWLAYGDDLAAAGKHADAAPALEQARALYERWAHRPLAQRRADPAPGACFVAAGHLAAARLVLGDLDAVQALYADLDLDPGLAITAALAALRAGDPAAAGARLRQALALSAPGAADAARIGLFVALAPSRPEQAAAQLVASGARYDGATDALSLALLADLRRPAGGVTADLRALVAASPADPVLAAALAVELRRAGASDADDAVARALGAFDAALASTPRDGRLWADYGLFMVSEGRLEDAERAGDLARVFAPSSGDTWLAAYAIRVGRPDWTPTVAAAGDPDLARAAAVGVANPAYAALAR